jgi:hypothetical protein
MSALIRSRIRSLLSKTGVEIHSAQYDMDSWFESTTYEDLLLRKTAEKLDKFLLEQDVFRLDKGLVTSNLTREFYNNFKE